MLFETLSQPLIFLFLAIIGFASGLVFDMGSYIVFLCKNNRVVKIIADFFCTLICFAIFYCVVLTFDYGMIRLYHFFTFILFLTLEQVTIGKLIAIIINKCYNFFVKVFFGTSKGLQKIKWKNHNKT